MEGECYIMARFLGSGEGPAAPYDRALAQSPSLCGKQISPDISRGVSGDRTSNHIEAGGL